MRAKAQRVVYDRGSDVLYITIRPGEHGIAREGLPGVMWRYGPENGKIVGVTILDFAHYWATHLDELTDDLGCRLNIRQDRAKSLLRIGTEAVLQ